MFHISVNFGIKNSYFIGYPNGLQMYHVLVWACCELQKEDIDYVLIGGVEDNLNFLVTQHYLKNKLELPKEDRVGFMVLERNIGQRISEQGTSFILEDLISSNAESDATSRHDNVSLLKKFSAVNKEEILANVYRDKLSSVSAHLNVCALFEKLAKSRSEKNTLELTIGDSLEHHFKMTWRIKSE